MQTTSLSDTEIILLEALDALGGNAHISELKGAVRWQARGNAHKALAALHDRGLLTRYARGCYTVTPSGRDMLKSASAPLNTPSSTVDEDRQVGPIPAGAPLTPASRSQQEV
jgi:hypothetical protein